MTRHGNGKQYIVWQSAAGPIGEYIAYTLPPRGNERVRQGRMFHRRGKADAHAMRKYPGGRPGSSGSSHRRFWFAFRAHSTGRAVAFRVGIGVYNADPPKRGGNEDLSQGLRGCHWCHAPGGESALRDRRPILAKWNGLTMGETCSTESKTMPPTTPAASLGARRGHLAFM